MSAPSASCVLERCRTAPSSLRAPRVLASSTVSDVRPDCDALCDVRTMPVFGAGAEACDPYPEGEVTRCCSLGDAEPLSVFRSVTRDVYVPPARKPRLFAPSISEPSAMHLPALCPDQAIVCTLHRSCREVLDSWKNLIYQWPAEILSENIAPQICEVRVLVYHSTGPLYCSLRLFAAPGNAVAVAMRREDGCAYAFNQIVSDFVCRLAAGDGPAMREDPMIPEMDHDFDWVADDASDWSWIDEGEPVDVHLLASLVDHVPVLPLKHALQHRTEELILRASACDAPALCDLLVKLNLLDATSWDTIGPALSTMFAKCSEFGQLRTLRLFDTLAPIPRDTVNALKRHLASDRLNERLQELAFVGGMK
eukprot:GEMP01041228.1.p1 GENE.GEMP01041228.1~~GEMP01041228.1.p1  ORF type:complete len:366 (+),score=106.00 GEMP01041228.1:81-1178(+)